MRTSGPPQRRRVQVAGPLCAVSLAICAGPAAGMAILQTSIVAATCGISGAAGTTFQACSSQAGTDRGFQATLGPGETAFVSATLRYTYSDDGLALATPATLQLDSSGVTFRQTDHEVGVMYMRSNLCQDRFCAPSIPPWITTGGIGFPPTVLGENDSPDRLAGEIALTSFVSVAGTAPAGFAGRVFVDHYAVAYAGIAAVPEPASWLLLAAGLAALSTVHRRVRWSTSRLLDARHLR